MRPQSLLIGLLLMSVVATAEAEGVTQPRLIGETGIHDPSVIVVDGNYVAFGTGGPAGQGAVTQLVL